MARTRVQSVVPANGCSILAVAAQASGHLRRPVMQSCFTFHYACCRHLFMQLLLSSHARCSVSFSLSFFARVRF